MTVDTSPPSSGHRAIKPLLFDGVFANTIGGHLIVDFLSGQRYVILTFFVATLSLSNSTLGLLGMLYMLLASLTQPVFGYLADRFGPRWLMVAGLLWLGLFYALAVIIPGPVGLSLFVIAGIGSAAFHPAATMMSRLRSHSRQSGRETTATAIFFLFGQTGQFAGPLTAGLILDRSGLIGLSGLALLVLPFALTSVMSLKAPFAVPSTGLNSSNSSQNPVHHASSPSRFKTWKRPGILALLPIAVLAAFQSWSQQNMVTFVPKYLSDLGQPPATYGLIAALFMGGSALGNVIGGAMADRLGKRRVAVVTLLLGAIPIFLIPVAGWSLWLYILIPLAGALTGATFSIIIVLSQEILPFGMALSSGLALGFIFSSGAVGTLITGYLADIWGFQTVFNMTAALLLIAALSSLSVGTAAPVQLKN